MKDVPRQQFRCAPHVSGTAIVKPRDYESAGEVEAANEYDAWARLHATDGPLLVGDLLETAAGELRICKYVGFEAAAWHVPEPRPQAEGLTAAATADGNPQPQA
jgi:hypothetical protein